MRNNSREQLELINQQLKELASIYSKSIKKCTVSTNEFWIWYALISMEEELSQQDICGMWAFSKQTVNTIISHMVKNNYVTLEVVPGTRNRKNIHLTERGRKFGESVIVPISNAEVRALERIPLTERAACIAVLAKYAKLLKEEIHGTEN